MDGLTISNAKALLEKGRTVTESRDSQIKGQVGSPLQPEGKSFAETLKDAVQTTNQMQKDSDQAMTDLATGKTKNIADVMIRAEKADISLKLMVQVRNKIIEAYQEIMKMQV